MSYPLLISSVLIATLNTLSHHKYIILSHSPRLGHRDHQLLAVSLPLEAISESQSFISPVGRMDCAALIVHCRDLSLDLLLLGGILYWCYFSFFMLRLLPEKSGFEGGQQAAVKEALKQTWTSKQSLNLKDTANNCDVKWNDSLKSSCER